MICCSAVCSHRHHHPLGWLSDRPSRSPHDARPSCVGVLYSTMYGPFFVFVFLRHVRGMQSCSCGCHQASHTARWYGYCMDVSVAICHILPWSAMPRRIMLCTSHAPTYDPGTYRTYEQRYLLSRKSTHWHRCQDTKRYSSLRNGLILISGGGTIPTNTKTPWISVGYLLPN
ncbi:hypothetical protein F5B21DRAFT_244467 [Xylaria acuta]|nr:hypothetical protein F5B21DRAFT_244467 [Xylaria acuta]